MQDNLQENQTYEDWKKIVDKLKKEVDNAKQALIDISIAKECQTKLLEYAEARLQDYPIPEKIIMAEDEEETEEAEEETKEEPVEESEAPAE